MLIPRSSRGLAASPVDFGVIGYGMGFVSKYLPNLGSLQIRERSFFKASMAGEHLVH